MQNENKKTRKMGVTSENESIKCFFTSSFIIIIIIIITRSVFCFISGKLPVKIFRTKRDR